MRKQQSHSDMENATVEVQEFQKFYSQTEAKKKFKRRGRKTKKTHCHLFVCLISVLSFKGQINSKVNSISCSIAQVWHEVAATDKCLSSATDMELTEQLFGFKIRIIITRSIPELIGILVCVFFFIRLTTDLSSIFDQSFKVRTCLCVCMCLHVTSKSMPPHSQTVRRKKMRWDYVWL